MPVELKDITLDLERKLANTDDTGFLVQIKPRLYVKNPQTDVVNWLKNFADDYWTFKHPDGWEDPKQIELEDPEQVEAEESTPKPTEISETGDNEEKKEEKKEENGKDEDKKDESKNKPKEAPKPKTGKDFIQFVVRTICNDNENLIFVVSNLPDPADYLRYVFDQMATNEKKRKTKFPMRAMPVVGLCVAKPKDMETTAMSVLEKLLGDDLPHRFSIQFYGSMDGENMTQKEAAAIVRNCIWSINPNCIQCLKYQDIAITIDIAKPFFCLGYLFDFIKLRRYKTLGMKMGYDLSEEGTDSEDEISDDPTLDEESEKQRKQRIKRKRNADKAFKNGKSNADNEAEENDEKDDTLTENDVNGHTE